MYSEKYGFVYIWYNKVKKMYYVGCHWGREDDGYICSSNWMRMSYKRHPEQFAERRTLSKIYTNQEDLLKEEHKWLQQIKKEELGKRYYNLKNCKFNHSSFWEGKQRSEETKRKISKNSKGRIPWNKGLKYSKEMKEKLSNKSTQFKKEQKPWNKGIPCLEETKKKLSDINKGSIMSEEHKEKLRQINLGNKYLLGKKQSEETKRKRSESMKGKNKGENSGLFGKIPWNKGLKINNIKKDLDIIS